MQVCPGTRTSASLSRAASLPPRLSCPVRVFPRFPRARRWPGTVPRGTARVRRPSGKQPTSGPSVVISRVTAENSDGDNRRLLPSLANWPLYESESDSFAGSSRLLEFHSARRALARTGATNLLITGIIRSRRSRGERNTTRFPSPSLSVVSRAVFCGNKITPDPYRANGAGHASPVDNGPEHKADDRAVPFPNQARTTSRRPSDKTA